MVVAKPALVGQGGLGALGLGHVVGLPVPGPAPGICQLVLRQAGGPPVKRRVGGDLQAVPGLAAQLVLDGISPEGRLATGQGSAAMHTPVGADGGARFLPELTQALIHGLVGALDVLHEVGLGDVLGAGTQALRLAFAGLMQLQHEASRAVRLKVLDPAVQGAHCDAVFGRQLGLAPGDVLAAAVDGHALVYDAPALQ